MYHKRMRSYKYWTENDLNVLKDLTSTGKYSFNQIGKIMGRTGGGCQTRCDLFGIKNRYIHRKYTVNDDYWDTYNYNNCYWAGFLAGDGCMISKKNHRILRLKLGIKDENHLFKFKSDVNFTGPISYITEKGKIKGKEYGNRDLCYLGIFSYKMGEDLIHKFNVIPNKTYRAEPPPIPNDINDTLMFCWLRGFLDADGCISLNDTTDPVNHKLQIRFTACCQKILEKIEELTKKYFSKYYYRYSTRMVTKNEKNHYYFEISGVKACYFFNHLKNLPTSYLARKWDNPKICNHVNKEIRNFESYLQTGTKIINNIPQNCV